MSSAPPNSTLGRILRSASFRLTLFYAALFIASAGALFATVYITATAAMQTPEGFETSRTNIASDHGAGNERRSIDRTAGRSP